MRSAKARVQNRNTGSPHFISGIDRYRCGKMGIKKDKNIDAAELDEVSIRSIDEFYKNKDKKNYKDRMLKEIDDYVKTSGEVNFADGIIDDLG